MQVPKTLLEISAQIQCQDPWPVILLSVLPFQDQIKGVKVGFSVCHSQFGTGFCYCLVKCENKYWLAGWASEGFDLFSPRWLRERDWETKWERFWVELKACYRVLCLWCGVGKSALVLSEAWEPVREYSIPALCLFHLPESAAGQRGLIQQCVHGSRHTLRTCVWYCTYCSTSTLVVVVPLD